MNITVFLASSPGRDPVYRAALVELAAWIGRSGHTLIYGGSRLGLMGVLAETAKASGGRVIGIEPQFFVDACLQYDGVDELIVTPDMAVRKDRLIGMADVVIVFPGGIGTLEELGQTLSMIKLGHASPTLIVYNVAGFYDPLRALLNGMVEAGFVDRAWLDGVAFADSLAALIDAAEGGGNRAL